MVVLTRSDLDRTDEALRRNLRDLLISYAGSRPVGRIAVVGNAPLEPSADRAGRIDAADLVIRCNSFALDDPVGTPCLGRRADAVVLNAGTRISPSVFDRYPQRLYLRSRPGAIYRRKPTAPMPKVLLWPDDLGFVTLPNRAVIAELRALIPHVAGDLGDEGGVVVPTSGTIAAWVAYLLFPAAELTLTGFSFLRDSERPTHWRHHGDWGAAMVPVSNAHKLLGEATLMRRWIAEGRAHALG